jgi:DNA-binding response OmpR family regulator
LLICGVQVYARSDLDVLADLLHVAGDVPVLYLTRLADEATRSAARGLGVTWVMPRPVRLEDVRGAARYAARLARRPIAPAPAQAG